MVTQSVSFNFFHCFSVWKAVLLFCFGNLALGAQTPDVKALLDKYPKDAFLYLNKSERSELKIEKEKLVIKTHVHEEYLILRNTLNPLRSRKIRTTDFVSVENLTAYLLVYNGKSHLRVKIKDIETKSEDDNESSFYSGDKFYKVGFLNAKEGDIVELDYDVIYNELRFFGAYYFSEYVPVLKVDFSLNYPTTGVKLKLKEYNHQHLNITQVLDSSKKTKTITWSAKDIEELTDEFLDVNYKGKASFILMNVEQYKTKDSTVQVGGSLKNLYAWYRHLIKNVDLSDDPELTKLSDSLTKNAGSNLEKMKNIFYWVQNKVAYLAYEDGLGGFVPREASVVCKRKFGDCKDMANLLVRLGQKSGLPVYHTWIGTNSIPFQFSEFPASFCANHMIATFIQGNDTLFLDATGKHYPFGLPTSMIQGKEGFIGINDSVYALAKVPFMKKEVSVEHDSIVLKFQSETQLIGTGYYTVSGYEKTRLEDYLQDKSYTTRLEYLKSILEKGNNKFKLDTFVIVQNETELPTLIRYNFSLSNYFTQNAGQNYINLNFLANYFDKVNLNKRKYPIEFAYQAISKITVAVQLDKTHTVSHVPDNIKFQNEFMGFTHLYETKNDYLIFRNTIEFDKTKVEPERFKDLEYIISNYKKNKSNLVSIQNH